MLLIAVHDYTGCLGVCLLMWLSMMKCLYECVLMVEFGSLVFSAPTCNQARSSLCLSAGEYEKVMKSFFLSGWLSVGVCICLCLSLYVCMSECVYGSLSLCLSECLCVCVCVCVCVCMCECLHVCVTVCVWVWVSDACLMILCLPSNSHRFF